MSNSGNDNALRSILFLGTKIAVGGAQSVLLSQAQWFHNKGYNVIAAFLYDNENLKERWSSQYPFPVIDLNVRRPNAYPILNGCLFFRGLYRLWRLIQQNKIDLIETFTPDSNLYGLWIARLAGVPVRIGSHHGSIVGTPIWRARLHGWMINQGFAHCLVAVSEQVYRTAIEKEKIRPDQVMVIKNGIELWPIKEPIKEILTRLRAELGLRSGDFVYLSVGRVTSEKGHTYLLEAVPKVLAHYPDHTVFIIAGEGQLRRSLEEKAATLGINNVVHFLGSRTDIQDLLTLADVFVMPSLSEGLPLALLEAMSVGLPVVASRVGGIEAVVSHGENGYLFEPKDIEAISSALIKIREDDYARSQFGNANRELIAREYTIQRMCSKYETLFLQMHDREQLKR